MSIAAVAHRHVFGIKSDVRNNIHFIDDTTIVYPCGSNAIIYNLESKTQKFIPTQENNEGMTCFSLASNKRYLAIAERGGEKPQCVIYDLQILRRRKTLVEPESEAKEYTHVMFSNDSKFVVALANDSTLSYWNWEKGKVMAAIPIGAANTIASEISFNPFDASQVAVVGTNIIKVFRYTDGVLKHVGFQKSDGKCYYAHCWLSETVLVGCSTDGHITVFDTFEPKLDLVNTQGNQSNVRNVFAVIPYSKGFICGGANGTVTFYEKVDDLSFKKCRELVLSEDSNIQTLCLSPNEETLICSASSNQIYTVTLGQTENKVDEPKFEYLSQPFHHGQITGMDTCIRKPLIATAGTDKSIRIWNYLENSNELVKYFPEEIYSIALHPSSLYVLVGFSDKLRLMNILIDDIRSFKEFAIRGCRECRFSNGGQHFAAVHGTVIQVYNTWTFECIANLKGHNAKVRSICWSQDDSKLLTAGMDGAIYEWNLKTQKRDSENILKSCNYTCAIFGADDKSIYAVGNDKTFKELADSQIVREIESNAVLTQIVMSHSGRMMFASTINGTIRSIKFPFGANDKGEYQEHLGHSSTVTRLRVSYDDQFLFSASEDGSLFLWKITDKEGRSKQNRDGLFADEILVTKSDLDEKSIIMNDLRNRVEELKLENEYQLRLKDMNFTEKIKEMTEKYHEEIEGLKITSIAMKTEKEKEEVRHQEEMAAELERHSKAMTELENTSSMKLTLEYEKYESLKNKSIQLQAEWEEQLNELQRVKEKTLSDLTAQYEIKLKETQAEIDSLQKELHSRLLEFDETNAETEEDAEREITELKLRYERRLKEEREIGLRLKGENGIMKKKFNSLQNEIEGHKEEIQKLLTEEKRLMGIIKGLERDIAAMKKEIQERDETIQDKEKRIYDIKKKNQELEKFKFVLDYKIKELKKQIEPREQDIAVMTQKIKDMTTEMENYQKSNADLELTIRDVKLKLKGSEKEILAEKVKVRRFSAIAKRFKFDLNECFTLSQDQRELKAALKNLHHRYCRELGQPEQIIAEVDVGTATKSSPGDWSSSQDSDAQQEYIRQREYLEKTMDNLKKAIARDQNKHKMDNMKIMQENVVLVREINELRKEIKLCLLKEKDQDVLPVPQNAVISQGKLPAITN
ncbi:WD repeat domain 65-like protein [Paraphysoderma sedebokerense]|nr:WD repeat domain 65-like protein [Paraphysoderma sedebokerense]